MRATKYSPHEIMFGRKSTFFLIDNNDTFDGIIVNFINKQILIIILRY